jgi:hypothetical protein
MQYDGIAVKTVTSTYPQMLFVNMAHPNIEMFVYPVPTRSLEWHFVSVEELSQPATLATTLSFPSGYQRAFAFNLALELCSEFGVIPPDNVVAIAASSKEAVERINNPNNVMSMPYGLVARTNRYNIYAGDS